MVYHLFPHYINCHLKGHKSTIFRYQTQPSYQSEYIYIYIPIMIPQLAGKSSIFNLCHPEVLVHLSLVPDGGESDRRGNRLAAFLALQITSQEGEGH